MRISAVQGNLISLPEGHAFPITKFDALYRILLDEGLIGPEDATHPEPAAWDALRLVHTEDYLSKLATGALSHAEERRLGFTWSETLVRRARLSVQGTINAARMALVDGIAANLGGGTHHAFPDHGEGFCVLNDVAIATRLLLAEKTVRRVLIVDLDVHQGNGTAAIFAADPAVYTFSVHGEKNYPWRRPPSKRDVELPDGTGDAAYLAALNRHLPEVFAESQPDLVFYLAGVDVLKGDRFGRLALTRDGIHARDRAVLEAARGRGIPLALVLAGGYAKTPLITADLHAIAHREARQIYGPVSRPRRP